jgi:hypothetical protein
MKFGTSMGLITVIFVRNLPKTWHNVHICIINDIRTLVRRHACRDYTVMFVSHYGGNGGNNNTNCQNCAQLEET